MKATWNGIVIAEAPQDDLIYIEQHWYFPPASVKREYLRDSDTPYTCPWKGVCQYFDVGQAAADGQVSAAGGEGTWSKDSAWCYPSPLPSAIQRVHKDFTGYVAFWRDVTVTE